LTPPLIAPPRNIRNHSGNDKQHNNNSHSIVFLRPAQVSPGLPWVSGILVIDRFPDQAANRSPKSRANPLLNSEAGFFDLSNLIGLTIR
jgi:hypothetical protein